MLLGLLASILERICVTTLDAGTHPPPDTWPPR